MCMLVKLKTQLNELDRDMQTGFGIQIEFQKQVLANVKAIRNIDRKLADIELKLAQKVTHPVITITKTE